MSRLDRLVSLLDTGTSIYVRNLAADQLADVQKSHPEELFSLLGRVVPFLRSTKWDTRIAAARAIGLIVENVEWSPTTGGGLRGIEHVRDLNDEIGNEAVDRAKSEEIKIKSEIKHEADTLTSVKEEPYDGRAEAKLGSADTIDGAFALLTFENVDIRTVITKGKPLLGSAGKEYDNAMQNLDPTERYKLQQQNLKHQLGFAAEFAEDATSDMILDDDLGLEPAKPKASARQKAVKKQSIPDAVAEEAVSDAPAPMNARMRALAKRKAKFGGKSASKVQIVDVAPKSTPAKDTAGNAASSKVVVEHREGENMELTNLLTAKDSQAWPFEALSEILTADMFSKTWEVRHGALLGLRELIKSHSTTAGMFVARSVEENTQLNSKWLEDMACRLCCIQALDRFADYVADEVVAPVRESCAQTIGALLLHLPDSLARKSLGVLRNLVLQEEIGINPPKWAACYGGMLSLRYFVSVRPDILEKDDELFSQFVSAVFQFLENNHDDVQSIAAAALLPVVPQIVEKRPGDLPKMLEYIWDAISALRDDLSPSVGHIMDLLARLCSYPQVVDILVSSVHGLDGFAGMVARLYPFLRHSITDVRKAVLRSLKLFLTIDDEKTRKWVNLRSLRLIFQDILLEQNDGAAAMAVDLWDEMLRVSAQPDLKESFDSFFPKFWDPAFKLLMTPIGTARRFYKMDATLMLRATGMEGHDGPNSTSVSEKVYIDGPVMDGDVLIVDPEVFIRNKYNACSALSKALALAGSTVAVHILPALLEYLDSPMSTQQLALMLFLQGYGEAVGSDVPAEFQKVLGPKLIGVMEKDVDTVYRDINPLLRSVRTQCQSLFSLMVSSGKLPSHSLPTIASVIEGDANAGPLAFNLKIATQMAGPIFEKLKLKLAPEIRVAMEDPLEEARVNLNTAIREAGDNLQKRSTSIKAAAASAYLCLNEELPTKLNPIIRSLMDSIKVEANPLLHERTAQRLSTLVYRLIDLGRKPAAGKIVKNLCSFLCVDVKEAPEFHTHQRILNGIMSLKRDDVPAADISEVLRKKNESHVVFIKRNGALLALQKLSEHYGGSLFDELDELPKSSMSALRSNDIANLPPEITEESNTLGQMIIDNMAVIRAILPFLDPTLHKVIKELLVPIRDALCCKFSVVRFVAAKCFSTVCSVLPTAGIEFLVEYILPKISTADDIFGRQGAVEAIYHIITTMGDRVLPYIVFFIVPTLGRMSDTDHDIRTIAATTFASIIKLVPLESGIEDPPNMPAKLLEGRDAERKFISQMMDISKVEPFELPITVKADLRKYQQEGVSWLAFLNRYHLHGVLCDDMGLGKTLQTICMVASDHHIRETEYKETGASSSAPFPSLVICPTSLTGHWQQEFKKYVPSFKALAYVGSPSARAGLISRLNGNDVVITSYDIARNDVEALSKFHWNYCVLDEGHIIKNATSKLSKAVKQYLANHRLVLTGTPIQNDVLELWSIFDFLMPGFLGSAKSFNERFSKPIIASKNSRTSAKEHEAAALALEALHKQVLPFLLRRLKEDVLDDLPPKIIQDYYCDLNDKQRKLYDEFTKQQRQTVAEELKDKGSGASKQHIFQALLYLRRLCNHPALVMYTRDELAKLNKNKVDYAQSPKLLALQQLLKDCGIGDESCDPVGEVPEAMSQHRALIFCQQKDMLDLVENSLLKAHMPSVSYMRLDGTVAGPQRHEMVAKFNDDPSIDVLLLSTHVGGLGLNLTGADTVIFVEHDWNPMNDLQAMDRAHRIGQKKVVNVYRLITRDTLEERIMGLQEFKLNIASTVITQQNSGLMSMDTDQILDLFSATEGGQGDAGTAKASKIEEDAEQEAASVVGKDVIAGLGELWNESEYADEYNVDNFIKSLKRKGAI